MNKKDKPYYTAGEVAKILSVNIMTIYRYINARRLVAHKIGKEFRIDHAEFKRFMAKTKIK
jgi:excisionase family DNA binding protein